MKPLQQVTMTTVLVATVNAFDDIKNWFQDIGENYTKD